MNTKPLLKVVAISYNHLQGAPTYTARHIQHWYTTWSRVLLEKLTDFQLVKKSPAFYGT